MRSVTPLSTLIRKKLLRRYAMAIAAVAVALAIGRVLTPYLGTGFPYIVILSAVTVCAWYLGLGPSIFSTFVALAGLKYWFIPPVHSPAISTLSDALVLLAFLFAAGMIIAIGEVRCRENEHMRAALGELEERVKQRTADLDTANQGLRELSARLMQLQDEERRRIARELHDSLGQMCAALSMNLGTVEMDLERLSHTAKVVADSAALVQQMNKEVRTISYLLHPPLLDEAGLDSALQWYVEGFSERSKIKIDLQVGKDFGRLPQEIETAVFRTVQECLTNIHRHSGSSGAKVHLSRNGNEVRLRVQDRGSGMSVAKLDQVATAGTPGVGLRGMRERLRQLGGNLQIDSNGDGTTVEAWLPIAASSSVAA